MGDAAMPSVDKMVSIDEGADGNSSSKPLRTSDLTGRGSSTGRRGTMIRKQTTKKDELL